MSELKIQQRRFTTYSSGLTKYHIELLVSPGTTPSTPPMSPHVFVQTLGASVPEDVFARVATLADMDLVNNLRPTAVTLSHTEYRVAQVTLTFDDLDTAIAAVPVINDRVDSLVSVWLTAKTDFYTLGEITALPTDAAGASVKNGYQVAFRTANEARVAAEAAAAARQLAFEAAQSSASIVRDKSLIHCGYKSKLAQLQGLVDTSSGAPSLNPAVALQEAVVALNAAADQFGRVARDTDETGGVATPNSAISFTLDSAPAAVPGDLLAITWASTGKTEIRLLVTVAAEVVSVHSSAPYHAAPTVAEVWRTYKLTDLVPYDDFGRSAASAARAQAALNAYNSSSGLAAVVTAHLAYATSQCSAENTSLAAQQASEAAAVRELEVAQAATEAAQVAENAAAAALLVVCPDIDLTAL